MPYLILVAFFAGGIGGWFVTSDHYEAKRAEIERAAVAEYKAEVKRGNVASGKLAQAETAINTQIVEVIKYVPKVTVGRKCLDAGAVWLLNNGSPPKLSETAREPDAESAAAPTASDTDVAGWIAIANGKYDICAARLNAWVDYEEGRP